MANEKSHFQQEHDTARAQYDKLLEGEKQLQALRGELDKMLDLGDMISPEDVVKGASNLVAHGFDPHELAVMLSGMPASGGEATQAWVQTLDGQVGEMEQRASGIISSTRHSLTTAAGHVLMEDHLQGRGQAAPSPSGPQTAGMSSSPSSNPSGGLTPSTPVMGNA